MSAGTITRRRHRASHLTKRVGKYLLGRTIGEGTYAKVKYAQHMETGEAVAIKVLDKEQLVRTRMVDQVKREIAILRRIHHPHVVNLIDVMSSADKIFVVMELVTGGDLFDRIAAGGALKEPDAKVLFAQLLGALEHCHARGICHRDLKPENVLMTPDGAAKLSDFGLGRLRQAEGQELLSTTCGTPNYVAPEVLWQRGYDGAVADVWSLGVLLYVVLAGCLPFDEDDYAALFQRITAAQYEVPPWLSAEAVAILAAMLQPDPAKRVSVEALWDFPWMRGMRRPIAITSLAGDSRVPRGAAAVPRATLEVVSGSSEAATSPSDDVFRENNVRPVAVVAAQGGGAPGAAPPRRLNAFELLNDCLDVCGLLEARDDVVTRHTRFTTAAAPAAAVAAVESAAVAVGARVERKGASFVRMHVPNPRGMLHVSIHVFEIVAGKRIVDVAKISGDTAEFYAWFGELVTALGDLVTYRDEPIVSKPDAQAKALRQRRLNAFALIASSFNLAGMFEEEEETTPRSVQFSSRSPPGDIVAAICRGVVELGGRVESASQESASLVARCGGGRSMRLSVRMFELLPGVRVVQITKGAGSVLELYKLYNKLAAQFLGDLMIRRKDGRAAHPRASAAESLVSTSALSAHSAEGPRAAGTLSRGGSSAALESYATSSGSGALMQPPLSTGAVTSLAAAAAQAAAQAVAVAEH